MRLATLHCVILRGRIFRGEGGRADGVAWVVTLPKHRGTRSAVLLHPSLSLVILGNYLT